MTPIRSFAGMSAARKLSLDRPMTVPRRSATAAVVVAAPMSRPSTNPASRLKANRRAGRPFRGLAESAGGWSSSTIQPRLIRSSHTAITEARVSPVTAISSEPVATSAPRMWRSTAWALTRRSSCGVAAAACGITS